MAAAAGIERALAHQPVHTGFGTQPTVGVLAFETDSGRLDAGHIAGGGFHQLGLETVGLAPAQVHAQHHLAPVLGLGATGTGLDIQIGTAGIHLPGEHAPEFQIRHHFFQIPQVAFHFREGVFVPLFHHQIQQGGGVFHSLGGIVDGVHDHFQLGAFLAQGPGIVRVAPDIRVFKLALDFGQTFTLLIVVKDTP